MSLLPTRLEISSSPADPEILDIEGEKASDAFDVLGSETARSVLAALYEEPRTPPEIREEVGTSLQNVHYHLDRLESAHLIEPAGTGYSETGNEMNVYAPATEALVFFAGEDDDRSKIEELLKRVAGLVVVLTLSTVVFAVVTSLLERRSAGPESISSDDVAVEAEAVQSTASTATGFDPVVAFALGGGVVILILVLWWVLVPRISAWRKNWAS